MAKSNAISVEKFVDAIEHDDEEFVCLTPSETADLMVSAPEFGLSETEDTFEVDASGEVEEVEEVEEVDEDPYANLPTTSAKIRAMYSDGIQIKDIAKRLGIIYQHARNVAKAPAPKRQQAA